MIYLDTSFIAPYYLNEESSEAVAAVLNASTEQLAISDWTLSEFSGMLARRVRMKDITLDFANATLRLFVRDVRAAMVIFEPARDDFIVARGLLLKDPGLGLRTPDALHLAIVGNHKLTLYTLDRVFIRAAKALDTDAMDAGVLKGGQ